MSHKIHLIRTPDYDIEEYLQVCEFLQSFQGPMEFISTEYQFDEKQFDFLNVENIVTDPLFFKKYSIKSFSEIDSSHLDPIKWNEMFSLCDFYREQENVQKEDFVVLLTKRRNELNWFSSHDNTNAFVHTGDWERFVVDVSPKYPIAYQVVANIVRTFMDLDLKNIPNQYIHQPFKACMNDFCLNKSEIMIKISNARICPDCLARIRSKQVSNEMLLQVQDLFLGIRSEIDFKIEEKTINPSRITISATGNINLEEYNKIINMPELWKTIYIFFLRHPEGILLVNIGNYSDELKEIYKKCRPTATVEMVNSAIANLVHHDGASFNQKRSRINRTITDLLKEPRSQHYIIDGSRNQPYSIRIPRDLIDIRF